jgi:hypothetical protein
MADVSVQQALEVLSKAAKTPKARAALSTLRGELGNTEQSAGASDKFKRGQAQRQASQSSSGGQMPSKGNVRQMFGGPK